LAPNGLSYPELLSKNYLYNNYEELKEMLVKATLGELPVPKMIVNDQFFSKTSQIMLND